VYSNPSNLTPTHLHQPQYHAPGPLPLVLPPIRVVHQPPAETRGTKRKSADTTVPKRPKRARAPASLDTGPVATRCGVGPPVPDDGRALVRTSSPVLPAAGPSVSITSLSTSLPTATYSSLSQNRKPKAKQNSATDCWYFMCAVESDVQPMDLPSGSNSALSEKPHTSHISCKLCQ
jgi:hypothetical protein